MILIALAGGVAVSGAYKRELSAYALLIVIFALLLERV